jgi:hypothetical protein
MDSPPTTDAEQCSRLCMAAAHIERSMERVRICSAALQVDPDLRLGVADLLGTNIHGELIRAHEIIQRYRKVLPEVENG